MKIGAWIITILVLAHHAVAYIHGSAHEQLAISMATWQNIFINFVILALPVLGMVLTWTKWRVTGLHIVLVAMTSALIFSIAHHYMLQSVDHISHLPDGESHIHASFVWTAGVTAILEALSAIAAAYFVTHESVRTVKHS